MPTKLNKTLLAITIFSSLAILAPVAKGDIVNNAYVPLTSLPGVTNVNVGANGNVSSYLGSMYTLGIMIATALAVIMIMWGGIEYMSTDSMGGKEGGKEKVTNALFGLILALSSWLILNTINHQLISSNLTLTPVAPQSTPPQVSAVAPGVGNSLLPGQSNTWDNPNNGITPLIQGQTYNNGSIYYYSSTEKGADSGSAAGLNAYGGQLVANPSADSNIVGSAASSYYPGGTVIYNNDTGTYWVVDDNNKSGGVAVNNSTTGPNSIEYFTNQKIPGQGLGSTGSFTVVKVPSGTVSGSKITSLHTKSNLDAYLNEQ